MSRYEWEVGMFKVPAKEFVRIKKVVREAYNDKINEKYNIACKIYDNFKLQSKNVRGQEKYKILYNCISSEAKKYTKYNSHMYLINSDDIYDICLHIAEKTYDEIRMISLTSHVKDTNFKALKVKKPVKSNEIFKKKTVKDNYFSVGCLADIIFDSANNTIQWEVPENNHAVENARAEKLTKVFFAEINRCRWTKRTGGYIYGGDEYGRENGDGAFIKETYGKCKKQNYHSGIFHPPML